MSSDGSLRTYISLELCESEAVGNEVMNMLHRALINLRAVSMEDDRFLQQFTDFVVDKVSRLVNKLRRIASSRSRSHGASGIAVKSRASVQGLFEEVSIPRANFQKVGMIMQVHEQHIVVSGVVTQEMAQYVNALIRENEKKSMQIESLVKEFQVQSEILRQHQEGQQVLAEVLKMAMAGQQPRQPCQQDVTGTGQSVTVKEVDDTSGTDRNFPNAPSPNSGPPNIGGVCVPMNEVMQVLMSMEMVPRI